MKNSKKRYKSPQLTPRQKNANAAMTIAVRRTKQKLKSRERTKTVTTYPDGLYKKTLRNELNKSMREVDLAGLQGLEGKKKSFLDKLFAR